MTDHLVAKRSLELPAAITAPSQADSLTRSHEQTVRRSNVQCENWSDALNQDKRGLDVLDHWESASRLPTIPGTTMPSATTGTIISTSENDTEPDSTMLNNALQRLADTPSAPPRGTRKRTTTACCFCRHRKLRSQTSR
ncbi:hypothetical protein BU25DRAFT_448501 [Macroventuria anomochaeta]|uniref:Uncharacterized protein n=1 Tax=Macroventuria anomochaeta TaxID=301207 RepID=A0ACB6S0L5_9PLEO|nr:uncharacterized protein BU25DRAFT_448501 [Macroventuria anomochaeta]KAF2627574.1 hypothetical protein BU25DRAFT_448501 [Macroventuria anomochaeta]